MPGIQGMGRPTDIQTPIPNGQIDMNNVAKVPDIANMPGPQGQGALAPASPEIDYDSLAQSSISSGSGEIDYDSLAQSALGGSAPSAPLQDASPSDMAQAADTKGSIGVTTPNTGYVPPMGGVMEDAIGASDNYKTAMTGAALDNPGAKIAESFAKSPSEKKFVLEKAFGEGNVKKAGGDGFLVKKDGKWQKFDNSVFGWTRDLLEQGVAQSATGFATALGAGATVATGGAAAPLGIAGIGAARFAGGAAGTSLADMVQEHVLGIPRDPDRSRVNEALIAGGTMSLLGAGGDWLEKKLIARAAIASANKLPQTDQVLKESIQDFHGAVQELEKNGIGTKVNTPYGQISGLPEQASQASDLAPDVVKKAQALAEDKQYQSVNNSLKQMASDVVEKFNASLTKTKNLGSNVGNKFQNYVGEIEKAEGALIGGMREQTKQEAGDGLVVLSNAKSYVDKMAADLGYAPGKKVTPQDLINKSYADTEAKAKAVMDAFEKVRNIVYGGNSKTAISKTASEVFQNTPSQSSKITVDQLDGLYNTMQGIAKPYWKNTNDQAGASMKGLWGAVRDDYTQAVGTMIEDGRVSIPKGTYQAALDRYSQIKSASEDIKGLLKKEGITGQAVADSLFNNGQSSIQNINAVKAILQDDPQAYDQLKQIYLNKQLVASANPKTGIYDGNKYFQKLKSLPEEVQAELIGGTKEQNLLRAAQTYVNRIQNYSVSNLADTPEGIKLASSTTGFIAKNWDKFSSATWGVLANAGQNASLVQYLNAEGQAAIIAKLPVSERSGAMKALDKMMGSIQSTQDYTGGLAQMYARDKLTKPSKK